MKPKFEEIIVNTKVIKCKECKNGKFYIVLRDLNTNTNIEIFSNNPYFIGKDYTLEMWKVTNINYYVKKSDK